MKSLEGRTWEKFSCTVGYESGKWHLSPESVLHEMGFRIFSPAIKSVYPYISSAFFSHYFRVSGRFCERWPIIRIPLSHGAGGSLRQHAAWYDSRYVDGRMTCGYALPRLRLRAQRASSGNAGSPMSVEVVTSRNVISPSDFQTAMDLKYVRDVKEAPRKVTDMFFLVEPSTGVALPILAGRTQLYGRFTGTPDDGMIVDIAVRSVRKCRNEVFDEDSSDSGDVSFRRFLEKNGGADDKDVAQYIEQNDGVLRELVERRGSDDDYRKLREAVYLLRRRLGEGDAQDVVWNDGNGSGEGNSDGGNDVREVVEQDGACIFAHSRLHCDCRAEYYIESYCANPECSEVHEQCYCARHFA